MREQLEALAAETGRPAHELFFEVACDTLACAIEQNSNGGSMLGEILSSLLGIPVRIDGAFVTYYWEDRIKYPALQVHQENMHAADGSPLSIRVDDPRVSEGVSNALGYIFQLEWVKAVVVGAR
jgi:hypothetical protein